MFYLLSTLWFIRTTKIFLFYFWLWQVKEYHIGRLIDHFSTEKGKRLIMNRFVLVKLLILFPFLIVLLAKNEPLSSIALGLILFLYIIESIWAVRSILKKEFKKPVLTQKTIFLIPGGLLIEILIFFGILAGTGESVFTFVYFLLLADILAPLIASFYVVIFQIPTVIIRNELILKKAKRKRMRFKDLKVVGITGSYGKTSVKELLAEILSSKFKVLKTKEHQNSEMGISQTILKDLKDWHEIFVVEMGAYNKGKIKLLTSLAKPSIGILTGINEQHMSLFGSQENIIKTKYELIQALPKNGLAVFNGDNDYCLDLYKKTAHVKKLLYRTQKLFLGVELEADIWAKDIRTEKEHISFKVFTKEGESADFRINILGRHNISNILAAVIVAKNLGMSLEEISSVCLKITPKTGSIKIIKGKDDPYILDASYSANPDGVISDLNYLKILSGKKFIVMPCLIELGRASKKVHRRIGTKIGEVCDFAFITTKERFEDIKKGALASGMEEKNILYIEDSEEIVKQINLLSSPGDVVLLEGRVGDKLVGLLSR